MKIEEIKIDEKLKVFDLTKHQSSTLIYSLYDLYHKETYGYTYLVYEVYDPTIINESIDQLETLFIGVKATFNSCDQIYKVSEFLLDYFNNK